MDDFARRVSGVGALAEPVRRELYLFVAAQPEPVSRDQAAEGAGVPRHTAKFHLDKLVEEGLLATTFRRLSGREGPGAGRPSKLYERCADEVSVTLPERRYDLAGQLMAAAIDETARDGGSVLDALGRAAREEGLVLGDEVKGDAGPRASRQAVLGAAQRALAAHGYEPRLQGDTIMLANCPFHALARDHTELVCGMNLALIDALADRGSGGRLSARLDPGADRCCVVLTAR
jgi:predicted ArsR family transcriptional regulator